MQRMCKFNSNKSNCIKAIERQRTTEFVEMDDSIVRMPRKGNHIVQYRNNKFHRRDFEEEL